MHNQDNKPLLVTSGEPAGIGPDIVVGLARRLREQGISTAVYYPRPLHLQPAYVRLPRPATGLAVSERLAGEVLSIPMHPYLDEATQDRIVVAIREAVKSTEASSCSASYIDQDR